jgi:ATP-dependent RNA helicase SUPV3L1/SUV3
MTCSRCCRSTNFTRSYVTASTSQLRQPIASSSSNKFIPSFQRPGPSSQSKFNPRTNGNRLKNKRSSLNDPNRPAELPSVIIHRKLQSHLIQVWRDFDPTLIEFAKDIGVDKNELRMLAKRFASTALDELANEGNKTWDIEMLRLNYKQEGMEAISKLVMATFIQWSADPTSITQPPALTTISQSTQSKLFHLARLSDYRNPGEFFPFARRMKRTLILHVGPTNSGKTYSALVALARARTGVYAGPLRLLAHEVFSRYNEGKIGTEGKRVCNLITGEEQRILDVNHTLSSCTVEMFPLNRRLDVGVIDEIQMIGDVGRGTAWTAAVIGSQCDELHLCGEESVVPLIQKIAADLGDDCIVKRYQRLSPLAVAADSLDGKLTDIRKGDCLVTFSRNNIFAMKRLVELKTGFKVAVAYGGLPPEVREEQARAFNAGEYDVLVASDAVGMGLNLFVQLYSFFVRSTLTDYNHIRKIKRVVFETLHKFDGKDEVALSMPQIKQIAGRAGRFGFNTADSDDPSSGTVAGEVTTLDANDMTLLNQAMVSPTTLLTRAAVSPPDDQISAFAALLPAGTPHSKILTLMTNLAITGPHYTTVPFDSAKMIADRLQDIEPLTFSERVLFGNCPANLRDEVVSRNLIAWVGAYAKGQPIFMKEWGVESGLFEILSNIARIRQAKLDGTTSEGAASMSSDNSIYTPAQLALLESFHRTLTLYLWLSFRLNCIFSDGVPAAALRREIEQAIDFTLEGMKFERNTAEARKLNTGQKRKALYPIGKGQVVGDGVRMSLN